MSGEGAGGIAIVGGGFSGAAVAWHLARAFEAGTHPRRPIVVFEPRPRLGAGVAYSSSDPAHRINVPSDRMSLRADRRRDFDDWLSARPDLLDPAATLPDGRRFPRRSAFGAYMADRLAPDLASGAIVHVASGVADIAPSDAAPAWHLTDTGGVGHAAATLVLALSHPPPDPPACLRPLRAHPALVADPWEAGALDRIGRDARVLVVGTGLSMADAIASLERRRHRGPVLAVSRRGQLSRGHAVPAPPPSGEFRTDPERTALGLSRRVRREVSHAAERGLPWQAVLDAVREQAPAIWGALPDEERRRVVRHLRPFWDTHRFRASPQAMDAIAEARAEGRLAVRASRPVRAAAAADGSIAVALRGRDGTLHEGSFDAVVVTTGPAQAGLPGAMPRAMPCLASLARRGVLQPDPSGLGLRVDAAMRAIGTDAAAGAASPFVAGPLARGRVGELMGLPEVAAHAALVARAILDAG